MVAILLAIADGSSPRAWGTHHAHTAPQVLLRFIPTGVGNSNTARPAYRSLTVHPHGRGELRSGLTIPAFTTGSSPRAWGTHTDCDVGVVVSRFIPTGVGNSLIDNLQNQLTSVHPHGRGELWCLPRFSVGLNGSSPRAWGTPVRRNTDHLRERFIPTGVGNSRVGNDCISFYSVHPHGRGELRLLFQPTGCFCGSSPRAWGTPISLLALQLDLRFIPTGVGNSKHWDLTIKQGAVHPHGRGELRRIINSPNLRRGSSPRAWGTLPRPLVKSTLTRFIPTGVGNSFDCWD